MTVLNDLDRFHLAMDVIDRLPQLDRARVFKQELAEKLIEHKQYIRQEGEDLPNPRLAMGAK